MKVIISLLLALLLAGCATAKLPPNLTIVTDRTALGGHLGFYHPGSRTVFLAPGANWDVLQHELNHHYFGSMGERMGI